MQVAKRSRLDEPHLRVSRVRVNKLQVHVGLPAANRRTSLPKRYLRRPALPGHTRLRHVQGRDSSNAPPFADGCRALVLLLAEFMTSMVVEGGEAGLVHAIPRVALVILGVAAFHRYSPTRRSTNFASSSRATASW